MKLLNVDDIDQEYILAQDVMTEDYRILLSKGTVLKQDYLNKLRANGIHEVYVNETIQVDAVQMVILRDEIEQTFRENVKSVMEKHVYPNSSELSSIIQTADEIIMNILEEDDVIERVYDIKERSADIYEHSISLCTLATLTALKLGLSKDSVHDIGVASLLHDLGLRYLTIHYENQNLDQLNEFEYAEYKKHPVYAYSTLKNETWISERSKNLILLHHEHLDGSGYPLHATELSIEARIISVCDSFDEMICGVGCVRSKVYEAIEYLKIFKKTFFDEKVVDTFLQFIAIYPVGTKVLLNSGETAVVIKQNSEFPERPVLRVIQDRDGQVIQNEKVIDLLREHSIFINDVMD